MKKIITIAIGVLLTGCASYRATPLSTLANNGGWMPWKGRDVIIVAKAFNEEDCKVYLDRDVIAKGYRPLQITIENRSDRSYLFSLNRVSLPCACVEDVVQQVHTSTFGRAAGYGAAALFLWPFAIPAVVDSVRSARANESLDGDFVSKAAKDQVIEAHAHINMLMFVPQKSFQKTFNITLIDLKTHEPRDFRVAAS
jgi:hypothetical protein